MSKKSYIQATTDVLRQEMRRDKNVFVMGEDLQVLGGAFAEIKGLYNDFGATRVMNTPISEAGIIGAAVGAACAGLRPVAALMFIDFAFVAMDQILNQAAKMRYMFGGQVTLPMVIKTQQGLGGNHSGQHSASLEALFMHVPGLKVVMPSNPADAAGLLRTAIRDDNPVLFLDNKAFFFKNTEEVPDDEDFSIPFGKARIAREGSDVTIVATHLCVQKSLAVAKELEKENISCEVIDPRTLVPFDAEAVIQSVKKTGRLVVAHESVKVAGPGAEIASVVMEGAFDSLKSAPVRVGAKYCTIPYSYVLEEAVVPGEKEIYEGIKKALK